MLKTDVFERRGSQQADLTLPTYNVIIGLVLCWGLLVNWLMVQYIDPEWPQRLGFVPFLVGYFASVFYGVYLFNTSQEPAISFVGYNLVVVPFGLIVNAVVHRYDPELVLQAIQVTAAVTIIMMLAGSLFPTVFAKIHTALTLVLISVVLIELVQVFLLHMHSNWIDWVVAFVFCGYIGYDWSRANQIPRTVDNAIDSAAAIYMDVINLFLRILRIMGRKK